MIVVNFVEKYRKFVQKGNVYVTGKCFSENVLIEEDCLLKDLGHVFDAEQFESKLSQYSGFYAVAINYGDKCFVAVDRVRSIPIFYSKNTSDIYISNDAEWVRQQVSDGSLDVRAEEELLSVGNVTGENTLFKKVKQLQAGEYLYVDIKEKKYITKRYFRFLHIEPKTSLAKDNYLNELDSVMNSVTRRLFSYAKGRQIVIPLSAGRDSRLIALKIKELGYENVFCFTYGSTGNFESETSRTIAKQLGFPWVYIEYAEELWKKWFNSPEREEYYAMACNYASVPHPQDWPAIWELKNRGFLQRDAVFVPGHCGAIAGGIIRHGVFSNIKPSIDDLIYEIEYYMGMCNISNKHFWEDKITRIREISHLTNEVSYVDAYENWMWEEYLAKYLINSVRVYEFWGYDWWLPLCDSIHFWQAVPLKYRVRKLLLNDYVDDMLYRRITGKKMNENNIAKNIKRCKTSMIKIIRVMGLYKFLMRLIKIMKMKNNLGGIHGFVGMFSSEFVSANKKNVTNVNGLNSIWTLEEIRNIFKERELGK